MIGGRSKERGGAGAGGGANARTRSSLARVPVERPLAVSFCFAEAAESEGSRSSRVCLLHLVSGFIWICSPSLETVSPPGTPRFSRLSHHASLPGHF